MFRASVAGIALPAIGCAKRTAASRPGQACTRAGTIRSVTRAPKLPRSFYAPGTLDIARSLIGMHLVHDDGGIVRVGRIVETEAYMGPEDLTTHSSHNHTTHTEVMFGEPGHAYVYFIYGFWYCLNVVTAAAGVPHAVLLRVLEPVSGITDKTWGPGLLCRALFIDKRLNCVALLGDVLRLERT